MPMQHLLAVVPPCRKPYDRDIDIDLHRMLFGIQTLHKSLLSYLLSHNQRRKVQNNVSQFQRALACEVEEGVTLLGYIECRLYL